MPANSQRPPGGNLQDVDAVLLAAQLIQRCGGFDEAHAALRAAARLRVD
jgi:hypothetical protein